MISRPAAKIEDPTELAQRSQQQPEQELGPLVSVIIVSYRRGPMLRRCLEAIGKSESAQRLQVIVLDLGNYDTTTEWDLQFPQITFLRLSRNFGATKALNIGIRSAQAEFLCFLDPAVHVESNTIPRLATLLEEIPEAGAVCPLLVDESANPVPQVRRLPERDELYRVWQDESAIPATPPSSLDKPLVAEYPGRKALVIRRSFLKGMNYFDEKYGDWGADLELAYQIRHAGKKALIVPEVKAVDHSSEELKPTLSSGQRATLAADRLNGVSHFLSKRAGFVTGLLVHIQAVLATLVRALTFQDPGYNWSLLTALIGSQKIDGSQGGI